MKCRNIVILSIILVILSLEFRVYSQSVGKVTLHNANKQIAYIKYTDKFNDFVTLSIKPLDSVTIIHELPMFIYSSTQNKDTFLFFRGGSVQILINSKQRYSIFPTNKDDWPGIQFVTKINKDSLLFDTYRYKFLTNTDLIDGHFSQLQLPDSVNNYIKRHMHYKYLVERNAYNHRDSLLKINKYLNCNECLNDDMYRRLASIYVDLLSDMISTKDNFQTIDTQFQGKTKDFLLFILMKNLSTKTSNAFWDNLEIFQRLCKDNTYKNYIMNMHKFNNPTDRGSGVQLIGMKENKVTIVDVLKAKKGKILLIDFWASWCSPCIDEMKYSTAMKEKLAQKEVSFLYFSIDDNASIWMEYSRRLGLNDEDSFLVSKDFRNEIKKTFNIQSIPHYILIDKDSRIFDKNARRPSDPELTRQIDYLLNR